MKTKISILALVFVAIVVSVAYLPRNADDRDQPVITAPPPTELQGETHSVTPLRDTPVHSEPVPNRTVDTAPSMSDDPVLPAELTTKGSPAITLPELSDLLSFEAFQDFLLETNHVDVSELFTPDVLEQMLAAAGRTETNLIAAHILSGDMTYLEEALAGNPDCVLAQALAISKCIMADTPPENLEEWIAQVRKAEPQNSIVAYWEAYRAFQLNDVDAALARFTAAAQQAVFDDYTDVTARVLEQFLIRSGISAVPSRAIALEKMFSAHGEQQRLVSGLVGQIDEMHLVFAQQNQQEDCIALAQHAAVLGARLAHSPYRDTLFTDMVGISIERKALEHEIAFLDQVEDNDRIAEIAQRLSALEQEMLNIKAAVQCPVNINQLLTTCSEAEVLRYFDLVWHEGEYAAWVWAMQNAMSQKEEE